LKWLILFPVILLTLLPAGKACAQNEPEYDEISVFLNVPQIGGAEIPGVILNSTAYLPITNIFDFLKIRNFPSATLDSISGFFIAPQATFLITYQNNKVVYKERIFELKPGDFIRTESNLYLKSKFFGEIFGLDCSFNFRSLSVNLTTKLELPVIREMRQEMMRANISRLRGEEKADSIIKRTYPFFHFGMIDWSIISTQQVHGPTDTRVNLSLGSVLAGGETNITINYSSSEPFTEKQQYYLWRYANNDHSFLRQAMAGKINSQATSSIYAPVVGVQLTNTPTTYRRSFGTYQLSDRTEPGWIVELYVNNTLVDYVKADASGFFTFQVPLVYGNTAVKLRFYGPWGEERSREQNISIPFNFLPPKELEYTVSAGVVEDSTLSRYSRGNINYGLSRRLTVGAGVEYLTSVTSGNTMPFVNLSMRLASSLLIYGEYTYGVRFKGLLSYRLPSNLQFELMYLNYNKHQTAINYNILEERKAIVSVPILGRNFSSFVRFTLDQTILPATQSTTAELLLSGSIYNVNANLTTYGMFAEMTSPYFYSNLSLAFRLPARFVFTPSAQFQYNRGQFISVKGELEKYIFRNGYANISYEQNFLSNISNTQIGLRYDFSFAQTGLTFRHSNRSTSIIESARGSMINESKVNYFGVNNRTNVGRGGIIILPFLDLNCDGHRDKSEPRVAGLTVRLNGGRIELSAKDTTIRVFDLEPYSNYFIELDRNSFDNIAWQIKKQTLSVTVDPNQFKLVEVAIAVVGEASGSVYLQGPKEKSGQGRIIVNFYDEKSKLVGRTISEAEGYFSFLGLSPGSYTARIDSAQLRKLRFVSKPISTQFTIHRSKDGDVVDNLEFILYPVGADTSAVHTPVKKVEPVPVKEKNDVQKPIEQIPPVNEPVKKSVHEKNTDQQKNQEPSKNQEIKAEPQKKKEASKQTASVKTVYPSALPAKAGEGSDEFQIQVGSFKVEANARNVLQKLNANTNHPAEIISNAGFFKVYLIGFRSRQDAVAFLPKLADLGYTGGMIQPRQKQ
jgi:cell division septation protein DedD